MGFRFRQGRCDDAFHQTSRLLALPLGLKRVSKRGGDDRPGQQRLPAGVRLRDDPAASAQAARIDSGARTQVRCRTIADAHPVFHCLLPHSDAAADEFADIRTARAHGVRVAGDSHKATTCALNRGHADSRMVKASPRHAPIHVSTRLTSFGGGAVAGVFVMWFVGAQPPTSVVPSTTQAVIRQATLPPPDVPASASNVELAAEGMRPSSTSLPSSTVSITARPVGTTGHSRVASAPSARPRKAAAAPHAPYRGSLAFQSAPQGAQVFVNGAFVGSTPLILENLPVGSRAVRIEADGYQRWSASTRVVANQQTRVSATLGRVIP